MIDVVCLGILVADVVARPVDAVPQPERSRSSTRSSSAAAAARSTPRARSHGSAFGPAVIGKVGTDAFGDFVVSLLRERGVDGTGVIRDPVVPTSASVALVDSAGERTFLHNPGANGALRPGEIGEAAYAGRALHMAGALVLDGLDGEPAAILAEARGAGCTHRSTPVFDASGRWERVLPALPHCDLVTPGKRRGRGDHRRERSCAAPRGASRARRGDRRRNARRRGLPCRRGRLRGPVAALAVDAVDGTGAGDAFAAGFLYGRLAGWTTEACARFANAAGALATTAVGAFEGVGDLDTRTLAGSHEGPPEPALRRRRPLLRRRRRPRILRRGLVPRRDRGHGADGRDARRGGARRDPALARPGAAPPGRPGPEAGARAADRRRQRLRPRASGPPLQRARRPGGRPGAPPRRGLRGRQPPRDPGRAGAAPRVRPERRAR